MSKCICCNKQIWFWQSKMVGFLELSGTTVAGSYHMDCYKAAINKYYENQYDKIDDTKFLKLSVE